MPPRTVPTLRALPPAHRALTHTRTYANQSSPSPRPAPLAPPLPPGKPPTHPKLKSHPLPTPKPTHKPPYVHPAGSERVFPQRKAFVWRHFNHLFSTSKVILLLGHDNLPVSVFDKLRRDILRAVNPPPKGSTRLVPDTPEQAKSRKPDPKLHVIRPAIFAAFLREKAPHMYSVRQVLKGPVAALTYPHLDPQVLGALLRVVDRAVPKTTGDDDPKPRRLQLLAGLVEGQVMYDATLRETAKLPTLEVLRAQIVGLLSAPAVQLSGVLEQARGGRAVRLLDSYAKGEQAEGKEEGKDAQAQ